MKKLLRFLWHLCWHIIYLYLTIHWWNEGGVMACLAILALIAAAIRLQKIEDLLEL